MSRRSRSRAACHYIRRYSRSPWLACPMNAGARLSQPSSSAKRQSANRSSSNSVVPRDWRISSVRGASSSLRPSQNPQLESCCDVCSSQESTTLSACHHRIRPDQRNQQKEISNVRSRYTFTDPRLVNLDGFQVELDESHERGDIILNRPPYNIVSMTQRGQLRLAFETLDEDMRVRIIVVRAVGEHFSSGGNIGGFMEASPEHVSTLAWNIASPSRCAKPVIVANRGYCFGVGFELSLACDFRIASETAFYALPEQKLGQIPGSGGSARLQRMI